MDARAQHADLCRYRATPASCWGVGVLVVLVLAFGLAAARGGRYGLLLFAVLVAALIIASVMTLQLELSSTTLRYRSLLGTRQLRLDQVTRAWLAAPRGLWSYGRAMPMFMLVPGQGRALVFGLQMLPLAAVADLGKRLAAFGVRIEVAQTPGAQRIAARIWPPPRRRR